MECIRLPRGWMWIEIDSISVWRVWWKRIVYREIKLKNITFLTVVLVLDVSEMWIGNRLPVVLTFRLFAGRGEVGDNDMVRVRGEWVISWEVEWHFQGSQKQSYAKFWFSFVMNRKVEKDVQGPRKWNWLSKLWGNNFFFLDYGELCLGLHL